MYREVIKLKGLFLGYHSIELMKLNNFCSIMFYYKNLKDKKRHYKNKILRKTKFIIIFWPYCLSTLRKFATCSSTSTSRLNLWPILAPYLNSQSSNPSNFCLIMLFSKCIYFLSYMRPKIDILLTRLTL